MHLYMMTKLHFYIKSANKEQSDSKLLDVVRWLSSYAEHTFHLLNLNDMRKLMM